MTAPPAKPALPLAEMLHGPEAGVARLFETINRRDKAQMRQALIAGLRQVLDEGHASARAIDNGYSPGKRVIYHAPSTQVFLDGCHGTAGLEGDLADYAIIRWTQCLNCWVDESHEYAERLRSEFEEWRDMLAQLPPCVPSAVPA